MFRELTLAEFLHITPPQVTHVTLSGGGKAVAFGSPVLVCRSTLKVVILAGGYPVIDHVSNTVDRFRGRRLRALFAQSFLLLPQLPFPLPRHTPLGDLFFQC